MLKFRSISIQIWGLYLMFVPSFSSCNIRQILSGLCGLLDPTWMIKVDSDADSVWMLVVLTELELTGKSHWKQSALLWWQYRAVLVTISVPQRHKRGSCHQTFMWPTKRPIRLPNKSYYCLISNSARDGKILRVKSLLCSVPNQSHFFTAVYVYTVLLSTGFLGDFSFPTGNHLLKS